MREYLCIARKHSTSNHRHLRTQMKETQGPSCIDGDLRLRTIVAAGPNLATGICKAQLLRLNDDEDREYGQELCKVRSAQHDGVAGVGVRAERGFLVYSWRRVCRMVDAGRKDFLRQPIKPCRPPIRQVQERYFRRMLDTRPNSLSTLQDRAGSFYTLGSPPTAGSKSRVL